MVGDEYRGEEVMAMVGASTAATIRCDIAADCGAEFTIEDRLTHGRPEAYWRHANDAHLLACRRVRRRFPAYTQGSGLDDITDERISRHLGSCERCHKAFLRFLQPTPPRGVLYSLGAERPLPED
jgi:hypothetical protein